MQLTVPLSPSPELSSGYQDKPYASLWSAVSSVDKRIRIFFFWRRTQQPRWLSVQVADRDMGANYKETIATFSRSMLLRTIHLNEELMPMKKKARFLEAVKGALTCGRGTGRLYCLSGYSRISISRYAWSKFGRNWGSPHPGRLRQLEKQADSGCRKKKIVTFHVGIQE